MRPHALRAVFRLMRPKHYIKNLLVFVPLFFSGALFRAPQAVAAALTGFVALSLTASAVYIVNDCVDAPADRLHPTKRSRPIASGEVAVPAALCLAALLTVCAFALLAATHPGALPLLAMYLLLNVCYSVFGLKAVPVIDVSLVALGFVLRVLFGSTLTDTPASSWLLLTILAGSYYMALGKRRNELRASGKQTRAVLGMYTERFLDQYMNIFLTLSIAFYSLWSVDTQPGSNLAGRYTVLTVPLMLLILMQYGLIIDGTSDGDPIEVLLRSKRLMALCALYVVAIGALIYMKGGL